MSRAPRLFFFFFFNDTATTEIYTLSLHDALPIFRVAMLVAVIVVAVELLVISFIRHRYMDTRSEEHTSELQSQSNLVCRLLLEKKKNKKYSIPHDLCRQQQGDRSEHYTATPL